MLPKDILAVCLSTIYLLVYCVLLQFNHTRNFGLGMFLCSPIIMGWTAYTVLKYGTYKGPELGDEEFGYQDKVKDELGAF